ncbi:MAG: hypothetical protein ACREPM_03335 [Gemmatimonadaceae bacterium]
MPKRSETIRRAAGATLVVVLASASVHASAAQLAPLPIAPASAHAMPNVQAIGALYGWMSGISGSASVRDLSASIDVRFVDLLKHLRFAAMGTFEAGYGPWLLVSDDMYSSVRVGRTASRLPNQPDLDFTSKMFIGQAFAGYAWMTSQTVAVDILVGGRLWATSSTLNISGDSASRERSTNPSWGDALGGIRVRWAAAPKWLLSAEGDGGGGGSKGTGEGMATAQYDLSHHWSLFASYRYLQENYEKNDFSLDVHLDGPLIGGAYRW